MLWDKIFFWRESTLNTEHQRPQVKSQVTHSSDKIVAKDNSEDYKII
jgi:hypothetical protein